MIHKSSVNAISPFPHTQSIIHRFRIDDEILGPWALKLASKIWLLLCFTSFFFLLPFFFLNLFWDFCKFFLCDFFFRFFFQKYSPNSISSGKEKYSNSNWLDEKQNKLFLRNKREKTHNNNNNDNKNEKYERDVFTRNVTEQIDTCWPCFLRAIRRRQQS